MSLELTKALRDFHVERQLEEIMGLVGIMALAANVLCLMLLWQHRGNNINMRSAWVCSRNDVIGNAGVLLAAAAVGLTGSSWPDILIGLLVATVFCQSAIRLLRDTSSEFQKIVPKATYDKIKDQIVAKQR
jgi:Co/Zn/Cd efflux system component